MNVNDSFIEGLQCLECGQKYPKRPGYVCENCFGPLKVSYDYEKIGSVLTKEKINSRSQSMWRYRELLPVEGPVYDTHVGFTPLVRADRLAEKLEIQEVWIKNDAANRRSLSFKDRVAGVALACAKEFGYGTVGCSSTGNLAHAVAAYGAAYGLDSYVFVPADSRAELVALSNIYGARVIGVDGTYDEVNRLCSEIVDEYDWAFVNINFRPFYAEGSKTFGFEIAEQLGWKLPGHIVVPMASGALLVNIFRAFTELKTVGLISDTDVCIHGAQPRECSPIADAVMSGSETVTPVENPDTIVSSLAVGDPGDGLYAVRTIEETGGSCANPDDRDAIEGVKLLAECEGILTEPAGGVVVSAARQLRENGKIAGSDSVVLCITGSGMKSNVILDTSSDAMTTIKPKLEQFEKHFINNTECRGENE